MSRGWNVRYRFRILIRLDRLKSLRNATFLLTSTYRRSRSGFARRNGIKKSHCFEHVIRTCPSVHYEEGQIISRSFCKWQENKVWPTKIVTRRNVWDGANSRAGRISWCKIRHHKVRYVHLSAVHSNVTYAYVSSVLSRGFYEGRASLGFRRSLRAQAFV